MRTSVPRPSPPTKAAEAKRVTGTKPSLPLARYAAVYSDSLYGEAIVTTAANGNLRLKVGTLEGALEHWQFDTFRARWDQRWLAPDLVTFVLGADGSPARIEMDSRTFARTDRGR
jgi:hypothetical protein